ncbi:hypothetical protein PENTCL1PPCAC_24931, partial [Pristionchus entomophagus]
QQQLLPPLQRQQHQHRRLPLPRRNVRPAESGVSGSRRGRVRAPAEPATTPPGREHARKSVETVRAQVLPPTVALAKSTCARFRRRSAKRAARPTSSRSTMRPAHSSVVPGTSKRQFVRECDLIFIKVI